jgi:hypothetical protein
MIRDLCPIMETLVELRLFICDSCEGHTILKLPVPGSTGELIIA